MKEMGGMMREGKEVRKWMRRSYWDGGSGEGGRKRVQVMKAVDGYKGKEEGGGKIKMDDGGVAQDECSYEKRK